ncbi:MAG: hypothetical protein GY866_19095 [Proteobacteria bacterium]|nr:hypothetical protein [Pseudomonadota bacterium]
MKKLSGRGQKWLKCFHIVFACMWVGAAVCLVLMNGLIGASNGMELYGARLAVKFVDDFIIIPGAIGSLLTGLLYSLFTNWGWFKHRWIAVKWIINIYGVVFGTIWLGPWTNSLPLVALEKGLDALTDPVYIRTLALLNGWGGFQLATLLFAVFISVLKPWKQKLPERQRS